MPAIVLANYCNVSLQSANIRYKRLQELDNRKKFNSHPLERQVYERFLPYIQNITKSCNGSPLQSEYKINKEKATDSANIHSQ